MDRHPHNLAAVGEKKGENSLAPGADDALAFRQYTQRVWSKVAGRPISEEEADQIAENFGRFLGALAGEEGGPT